MGQGLQAGIAYLGQKGQALLPIALEIAAVAPGRQIGGRIVGVLPERGLGGHKAEGAIVGVLKIGQAVFGPLDEFLSAAMRCLGHCQLAHFDGQIDVARRRGLIHQPRRLFGHGKVLRGRAGFLRKRAENLPFQCRRIDHVSVGQGLDGAETPLRRPRLARKDPAPGRTTRTCPHRCPLPPPLDRPVSWPRLVCPRASWPSQNLPCRGLGPASSPPPGRRPKERKPARATAAGRRSCRRVHCGRRRRLGTPVPQSDVQILFPRCIRIGGRTRRGLVRLGLSLRCGRGLRLGGHERDVGRLRRLCPGGRWPASLVQIASSGRAALGRGFRFCPNRGFRPGCGGVSGRSARLNCCCRCARPAGIDVPIFHCDQKRGDGQQAGDDDARQHTFCRSDRTLRRAARGRRTSVNSPSISVRGGGSATRRYSVSAASRSFCSFARSCSS